MNRIFWQTSIHFSFDSSSQKLTTDAKNTFCLSVARHNFWTWVASSHSSLLHHSRATQATACSHYVQFSLFVHSLLLTLLSQSQSDDVYNITSVMQKTQLNKVNSAHMFVVMWKWLNKQVQCTYLIILTSPVANVWRQSAPRSCSQTYMSAYIPTRAKTTSHHLQCGR